VALEILVILALILVNGFFSLSEMAVVSSRKARLRQRAEEGHKGARMALETAQNPGRFLSTIQIVITMVGVMAGAFGGATVAEELRDSFLAAGLRADFAEPLSMGIVVVATTFLSVVFGELVPKNLALGRPELIAGFVAWPMRVFSVLFAPVVKVLSATTDLVMLLLRARGAEEPPVTEEEVKVLIAQGTETGIFDAREKEMFEGVLYLGDRRVTTFMTPRTDIAYLEKGEGAEELAAAILEHARYANLPLVDGDLDHVVGMVSVKSVLASIARGEFRGVEPFVETPLFVPETLGALDLFSRLKEHRCKSAVIIDEYGGVAGMVTFSDLAEAILGEVAEAEVQDEPDVVKRDDGSYLVDGGLSIDDFAEYFGFEEDEFGGDYETVAGLVLEGLGCIPKVGDRFAWKSVGIEVMDMDGNRVDKVLVTPAPEPEGAAL